MLGASGVGPGDEVIVRAHTFVASALALAHVGAVPVLCDVDMGTGLIDPDTARTLVGATGRRLQELPRDATLSAER
jgi:dTDP-3-amino-3,4,6-trideoxy-alpha-D-glucose transaminase